MIFEYHDGTNFVEINALSENLFFGDLDGYDGSSKTIFFRIRNELGGVQKNNLMLRVIEKYSNVEKPFIPVSDSNSVVASGGSTQIDGKLHYSLRTNAVVGSETGTDVTPDDLGLFRIGNLAADTGALVYAITVTADSGIIYDLGNKLKISEIYFAYFSTSA